MLFLFQQAYEEYKVLEDAQKRANYPMSSRKKGIIKAGQIVKIVEVKDLKLTNPQRKRGRLIDGSWITLGMVSSRNIGAERYWNETTLRMVTITSCETEKYWDVKAMRMVTSFFVF